MKKCQFYGLPKFGSMVTGGILAAVFAHAGTAYAEETPQERPEAASKQSNADDSAIIVTAQRREESMQKVPISISAFTGETLAKSGVTEVSELSTLTPGLVWSQSLSSSTPFIRGVGTTDGSAANESNIALYIDGQYYPSQPGASQSLSSVERVEVLKGPQGTLFGRNATGGLIQIITRTPSYTPTLEARIGYGNYDTVDGSVYASTGLAKNVATDLSVYYINQNDGWGKYSGTNTDVYTKEVFSIRSKTRAELGETVTATVSLDYMSRDGSQGIVRGLLPGAVSVGGLTTYSGSIYNPTGAPQPDGKMRQGGVGLKLEAELPFARLVSISGYRKVKDQVVIDQDYTPVNFQRINSLIRDHSFTQEVQLVSNSDGKLDWIVGGFFMTRGTSYDPTRIEGTTLVIPFGGGQNSFTHVNTRSIAGFGQASYEIAEGTKLTAGLRYTSDRQSIAGKFVRDNGVTGAYPSSSTTFNKLTWRLAIDQQIGDDTLLYASATRGFKGGVYNAANPASASARPEVLDAYEVGLKTDFLDKLARFNIAAFHYAYKDIQIQHVQGGFIETLNAGKARLTGVDAELSIKPATGLRLRGNLSWLPEAKYLTFNPAPISTPNPAGGNVINSNGDASGNRVVRAPKFTYTAAIDYTKSIGDDATFDFNLTWNHSSGFVWEPDNRVTQAAYGLLQAQAGLTFGAYNISVWAKNITKSDYYVFVNQSQFGDSAVPGAPRTYGISAGFKY